MFVRLLLGTGHLFYVVILTTRSSSRLQGEGSIFISQVESLSIGPAPRTEPTTFPLQSIVLPTELVLQRLISAMKHHDNIYITIPESILILAPWTRRCLFPGCCQIEALYSLLFA